MRAGERGGHGAGPRAAGGPAGDRPGGPTPPETRPAAGVWARHRVVDIHGHIGRFAGYDLSPETVAENVERHGIELLLLSNVDAAAVPGKTPALGEEEANAITAALVRERFRRFRGLVWARPGAGSPEVVERFLRRPSPRGDGGPPPFVGVKLHPEMNGFPADDPAVDGYLEACRSAGVPAVVHSDEKDPDAHPRRILVLARRHPEVPVILYHMGFEGPHDAAIEVAAEAAREENARLYLETAQADPDAVIRAVGRLGPERVLFGSDATYYGREHYRRYDGLLERLEAELPTAAVARILRGNALELFPLEGC